MSPRHRGAGRRYVERISLSASPRFRAILERSRAEVRQGKALSSDDMRRAFGLKRKVG